MRTRRVLFIDDDDSVLSNASRYTELAYRNFTAARGREAIVLEELWPKQPIRPRESE